MSVDAGPQAARDEPIGATGGGACSPERRGMRSNTTCACMHCGSILAGTGSGTRAATSSEGCAAAARAWLEGTRSHRGWDRPGTSI